VDVPGRQASARALERGAGAVRRDQAQRADPAGGAEALRRLPWAVPSRNRGGAEGDAEDRGGRDRVLRSASPRELEAPEDPFSFFSAVLRVPLRASAVPLVSSFASSPPQPAVIPRVCSAALARQAREGEMGRRAHDT